MNAAVSGYVLSLLAGEPAYFGDINMVDTRDGVARLINCGSIPGRLASADQEIQIVEQYAYMGLGRGASTLFCMKPGRITFGTLGRVDGRYVMSIAGGEAFSQPLEKLREVRSWAQGFVRLDGNPREFFRNIRCNHSVAAYGDHRLALREFCRQTGVFALDNDAI